MTLAKEWFTAAEIAALKLPMLPDTEQGVRAAAERWRQPHTEYPANPRGCWRRRDGQGGGFEYHYALFPTPAQAVIVYAGTKTTARPDDDEILRQSLRIKAAWDHFDRCPTKKKAEAERRLRLLDAVEALIVGGQPKDRAVMLVAQKDGVSIRTVYNWQDAVAGIERQHRLAFLVPHHAGRQARVEVPDDIWRAYKGLYLRMEEPSHQKCYRDLEKIGREKGWQLPTLKTLARRIEKLPKAEVILARKGAKALEELYPAMIRDKSDLRALDIVNADGHRFDVMVTWPDGVQERPIIVAFQDVYSSKILGWKIDRTENKVLTRLGLGQVCETYGIPRHVVFDNGRLFAAKEITGGTRSRFRFKYRDGEPDGLCEKLGIKVSFTKPYSGRSKPIERAWRDLAEDIAKDIRLAGAYLGKSPTAKPGNYGERTVPLDLFLSVVEEGIAAHNARTGRTGQTARGRSFDEVFRASVEDQFSLIQRPSETMRRYWLMQSEPRTVRGPSATVELAGNIYWHEALIDHIGKQVVLLFDPDALHQPIRIERPDTSLICEAACIEKGGFLDMTTAKRHAKAKAEWVKAQKAKAKAEAGLSIDQLADMLPAVEAAPAPEPRVIAPVFGNAALKPRPVPESEPDSAADTAFAAGVAQLAAYRRRRDVASE